MTGHRQSAEGEDLDAGWDEPDAAGPEVETADAAMSDIDAVWDSLPAPAVRRGPHPKKQKQKPKAASPAPAVSRPAIAKPAPSQHVSAKKARRHLARKARHHEQKRRAERTLEQRQEAELQRVAPRPPPIAVQPAPTKPRKAKPQRAPLADKKRGPAPVKPSAKPARAAATVVPAGPSRAERLMAKKRKAGAPSVSPQKTASARNAALLFFFVIFAVATGLLMLQLGQ
jgi:hypothetical protein